MKEPIIEIKNLGKKYNITHQQGGYVALRDVITNIFKNPFKFIFHKTKQIAGLEKKEVFWALDDINLTIEPGEVVGVIGRNGAGKSTLLKILSQITPPTTGEIKVRGTLGSLLEVGTGFHPELTGRENIMLNGAILGMTKKEIVRKFDAIVEFAGIAKFLDTPVKYYSSGMYVRLAFSVAAHLEPDILLVDEVLAVGDAEFQNKCLGKMNEITKKEGRTILFVSHNMGAVQSLCNKCILLEKGKLKMAGETDKVIDFYIHDKPSTQIVSSEYMRLNDGKHIGKIRFTEISVTDVNDAALIRSDSRLKIALKYESDFQQEINDIRVLISITSERSQRMVLRFDSACSIETLGETIQPKGEIICETDPINIVEGNYLAEILILPQKTKNDRLKLEVRFEVVTDNTKYNFLRNPEKVLCDHLMSYHFKQS